MSTSTANPRQLMSTMLELGKVQNYRGVQALSTTAIATAEKLRVKYPVYASLIYTMLGHSYSSTGHNDKAIGLLEQALAIEKVRDNNPRLLAESSECLTRADAFAAGTPLPRGRLCRGDADN
mmetsp:Transcript_50127/g.80900  ORF Transcript_50127/g.80900 Transcript_50127/m.80900 type:complete len:122 (-) Transcript_50127:974-1339(-)